MIRAGSDGHDFLPTAGSVTADGPDSTVTIPDPSCCSRPTISGRASISILSGQDGRRFVVHDYFKWDKHPTLVSGGRREARRRPRRHSRRPRTSRRVCAGRTDARARAIGKVEAVSGSATAIRGGVAVQLNMGDVVFQNDVIQTGSDFIDRLRARRRLRLPDDGERPDGDQRARLRSERKREFRARQSGSGQHQLRRRTGGAYRRHEGANADRDHGYPRHGRQRQRHAGCRRNTTSVTLSMMDNGVANIYSNTTHDLITTLTNNGNGLRVDANVNVTQVPKDLLSDQANLNALSGIVQSWTSNGFHLNTPPGHESAKQQRQYAYIQRDYDDHRAAGGYRTGAIHDHKTTAHTLFDLGPSKPSPPVTDTSGQIHAPVFISPDPNASITEVPFQTGLLNDVRSRSTAYCS